MGCCGIGGKHYLASSVSVNFINEETNYKRPQYQYYKNIDKDHSINSNEFVEIHTRVGPFSKMVKYFNRGYSNEYSRGITDVYLSKTFSSVNKDKKVKEFINSSDYNTIELAKPYEVVSFDLLNNIPIDLWIMVQGYYFQYTKTTRPLATNSEGDTVCFLDSFSGDPLIYCSNNKSYDFDYTVDEQSGLITLESNIKGPDDKYITLDIAPIPEGKYYALFYTDSNQDNKAVYLELIKYVEGQYPDFENALNADKNDLFQAMPVVPIYENTGTKEPSKEIKFYSTKINDKFSDSESEPIDRDVPDGEDWHKDSDYDERDIDIQIKLMGMDLYNISKSLVSNIKFPAREVKDEYIDANSNYIDPLLSNTKKYSGGIDFIINAIQKVDEALKTGEEPKPQDKVIYDENISYFKDLEDWTDDDDKETSRKEQLDNNKFIFSSYYINPFSKREVMHKAMFYFIYNLWLKRDQNNTPDEYGVGFKEGKFNKYIKYKNIEKVDTQNIINKDINRTRKYTSKIETVDEPFRIWNKGYVKKFDGTETSTVGADGYRVGTRKVSIYQVKKYYLKDESIEKHIEFLTDDDWILEEVYQIKDIKIGTFVEYGGYSDGKEYNLADAESRGSVGIPMPFFILDYMTMYEKDELAHYGQIIEIYAAEVKYQEWYARPFWARALKYAMYAYAAFQLVGGLLSGNPILIAGAIHEMIVAAAISYALDRLIEYAVKNWGLEVAEALIVIATIIAVAKGKSDKALEYISYGASKANEAISMEAEIVNDKILDLQENYADFQDEMSKLIKDETGVDIDMDYYSISEDLKISMKETK